jgi:hypothetical protein
MWAGSLDRQIKARWGTYKGCRVGKAKTMRRQTRKPGRKKLTSRTVSLKAAAWYAKASQSVAIKAAQPR